MFRSNTIGCFQFNYHTIIDHDIREILSHPKTIIEYISPYLLLRLKSLLPQLYQQ